MPLKTRGDLTVPFIAQCYAYLHFSFFFTFPFMKSQLRNIENCKYKHYYFVFS